MVIGGVSLMGTQLHFVTPAVALGPQVEPSCWQTMEALGGER